jgi:hypothetical protein
MSVLPAEVHTALSTLLKGLQSADNVQRTASEEELNREWTGERPDVLLMGLTEQIQLAQETSVGLLEEHIGTTYSLTQNHSQTRTFAAVLFRRQSSKPRKDAQNQTRDLFLTLNQAEREAIRAKLLQCLSTETDTSVRSKIGDAVAELGRQHTDEGDYTRTVRKQYTMLILYTQELHGQSSWELCSSPVSRKTQVNEKRLSEYSPQPPA